MAPMKEEPPLRSLLALSAGVAIALVLSFLPVHDHDDDHHEAIRMEAPHPLPDEI